MKKSTKKNSKTWIVVKQVVAKAKKEIGALYLAYKRHDVPVYARIFSMLVVGYALSPIDLIPDFIPVLGYLDDFILIPVGIILAVKLIPDDIMDECREQSENLFKNGKPKNWIAAGIIICFWITAFIMILVRLIK